MKKFNSFFLGILFFLLLLSCNRENTDKNKTTGIADEVLSDYSNIKKALENIYYLFPSPNQILLTMKEEGIVYKPELLNSVEKKEMYIKPNEQYLNLGVYIADFSYCSLFGRNNDAENYLETIRQISNKLNLSANIYEELVKKFEDNLYSIDSISKITDEFFYSIVKDLEENNRQIDVITITTGAYIECIYLSINNVDKFSRDNLIIQKVAEQMYTFNNLFKYSQKYVKNEDLLNSLSYIKEINESFELFNKTEEKIKVKKDGEHHIVIEGGDILSFSNETQFELFKENVTRIRNTITK